MYAARQKERIEGTANVSLYLVFFRHVLGDFTAFHYYYCNETSRITIFIAAYV